MAKRIANISTCASLRKLTQNNAASVDYNHPQHIRCYLENSSVCAAALPPSRGAAGFAGASLRGCETARSIIRSDGKSLCKVFCIITYQSQNSHPQILWVTKHQQLPHYCPPKSSPTNDKHRKKEEKKLLRFI